MAVRESDGEEEQPRASRDRPLGPPAPVRGYSGRWNSGSLFPQMPMGSGSQGAELEAPTWLSPACSASLPAAPPASVLPTVRQPRRTHRGCCQSFLPLSAAEPLAAGPSAPLCLAKPGRLLETQTHMGSGEGERYYDRGNQENEVAGWAVMTGKVTQRPQEALRKIGEQRASSRQGDSSWRGPHE